MSVGYIVNDEICCLLSWSSSCSDTLPVSCTDTTTELSELLDLPVLHQMNDDDCFPS